MMTYMRTLMLGGALLAVSLAGWAQGAAQEPPAAGGIAPEAQGGGFGGFGGYGGMRVGAGLLQEDIAQIASEVRGLQARLEILRNQRDNAKQRYKAGLVQQTEVDQAELAYNDTARQLEDAQRRLVVRQVMVTMTRPVSVQLREATLAQAAKALTGAAGMAITVDKDVATDARLTVDARNMPLAALLEAIANQTHLMLAPGEGGVVFKPWPTLQVNSKRTDYIWPNAPWSEEWGPGGFTFGGPPWQGIFSAGPGIGFQARNTSMAFGGLPSPGPGGVGGNGMPPPGLLFGSQSASRSRTPVALTALNDRTFVVAEAGTGSKGEAGVWLTLYRLIDNQFKKVSTVFHPYASGKGNRER